MAKDINQPGIDPKELKKQERNKLYQQLAKERLEKKQAKQVGRQKVQEEYRKQKKEIDEIEKVCKTDIVNKLDSLKQEVFQKKIGKKEAKSLFKTYRNDRIKQFRLDEQKILNLTSDELKQRFSFRIKR
jgi:hypothetical protein